MAISTVNSDEHTLVDYLTSESDDLFSKAGEFSAFLDDWKSKETYSYHRLLTAACGRTTTIRDRHTAEEKGMIVMASNNYLGLNRRPEVMAAAKSAVDRFGSGLCGSRFLSGTYELVEQLERALAEFEQREAAMVFTSGYQANVGTISALMRKHDVVFIDKLCHASIVDGCKLSGCGIRIFRHNDMEDLGRKLQRVRSDYRGALIVVDGVFSMDGDLAPLPDVAALAVAHNCRLMVDEAHGTGVVGIHGRGAAEHFGVEDRVDITLGTFSKSLASTGGFIAADRSVVDYVRHYGRAYMFSASPTPAVVASALASLKILREEPQLRDKLWRNIRHFHGGLRALGYRVCPEVPESGVLTVFIGEDAVARSMSKEIYDAGVFISTGCYPAVAQGCANLRLSMSALHTREDLDAVLAILARVGTAHGVI